MAEKQNYKMDELNRISASHCLKVFIHRDFSEGTPVRFQTKFPQDLDGRIDRAVFDRTVNRINEIFVKAETLGGRNYCESCMACLTAYLSYLCVDTYYEKCLKEITRFVEDQNKTVYVPRGLMLVDPVERGLRVSWRSAFYRTMVKGDQMIRKDEIRFLVGQLPVFISDAISSYRLTVEAGQLLSFFNS